MPPQAAADQLMNLAVYDVSVLLLISQTSAGHAASL
jgi:hypothetical protein